MLFQVTFDLRGEPVHVLKRLHVDELAAVIAGIRHAVQIPRQMVARLKARGALPRALGKQLGKTRGMFKAFKDEYQKASGGSSKAKK